MTDSNNASKIGSILECAPIMPVLIVEELKSAVPLARALVAGGLPVLEVTLRSPAALECIKTIREEVEGVIVGAGTVLTPEQFESCEKIGCDFVVSPGSSPRLLKAAQNGQMPYLPGAATASEVMTLLEHGYFYQKFFPAEAAGGVKFLASLSSPLPMLKFCPTGGITEAGCRDYFKLSNVLTVGGSWVAPERLVKDKAWGQIHDLAQTASTLQERSPGA